MKTIKQKYTINAPLSSVWDALVNPKTIDSWGGGPAKMDDKEGINFSLWGGDIYGKNIKVIKEKLLVQDWYGGDWEKPSKVTITLKEKEGKVVLELKNEGVPEKEIGQISEGWKIYYLNPIKDLLKHK